MSSALASRLAALPATPRLCLLLRERDRLTVSEIAERLQLSREEVREWLFLARERVVEAASAGGEPAALAGRPNG